jgi:hypothetical protein
MVHLLDEFLDTVATHYDDAARMRRDVVSASTTAEATRAASRARHFGCVHVTPPVHLERPEETDINASALQERSHHIGKAAEADSTTPRARIGIAHARFTAWLGIDNADLRQAQEIGRVSELRKVRSKLRNP